MKEDADSNMHEDISYLHGKACLSFWASALQRSGG